MKIKNVIIENLFGYKNFNWDLGDVNILIGKNGTGKTNILRIIDSVISFNHKKYMHEESIPIENIGESHYYDYEGTYCEKLSNINNIKITYSNNQYLFFRNIINEKIAHLHKYFQDKKGIYSFSKEKEQIFREILKMNINQGIFSSNLNKKIPKSRLIDTTQALANTSLTSFSNGNRGSLIEKEIEEGLRELKSYLEENKKKFNATSNELIKQINLLFKESDKVAIFEKNKILIKQNEKEIKFKDLSSGECVVIYSFLMAALSSFNNDIILMDEPEISLHLSWQKKFINCIHSISPGSQLIIVTHSPGIAMNGFLDKMIDISDIETNNNEQ